MGFLFVAFFFEGGMTKYLCSLMDGIGTGPIAPSLLILTSIPVILGF